MPKKLKCATITTDKIKEEVYIPYVVTLDEAEKGAKFPTKEDAIEAMWELYKDKMSRPDFDKMINDHIKEV